MTLGFDTSFLVAAEVAEHPDHDGGPSLSECLNDQANGLSSFTPLFAKSAVFRVTTVS